MNFFLKIIQTFFSVVKIILKAKFGLDLPKANAKTALILANGPSLNESLNKNIGFFFNKDIYAVNFFALSDKYEELKPKHYVLFDLAFFSYHPAENPHKDIGGFTKIFLNKTTWDITLYTQYHKISKKSYLLNEINLKHKNITVKFLNNVTLDGFNRFKFFAFNKLWGIPQCRNVLAFSLFICINKRYENVFFVGADHSWHEDLKVNENNELIFVDKHFYDVKGKTHDNPTERPKIHEQFYSLAKAFESYQVLKEYAESLNINVINYSEKSYIDAFKNKKISDEF